MRNLSENPDVLEIAMVDLFDEVDTLKEQTHRIEVSEAKVLAQLEASQYLLKMADSYFL